jgi:hypothetical protein
MRHIRSTGIRFKDVSGCDMALMQEFAALGYEPLRLPMNRPVGDHYLPAPEQLFSRWSEMVAKFGPGRVDRPMMAFWIDRVVNHGSPWHAAALLGVLHPRVDRGERNRLQEVEHPLRQMIAAATPDQLVSRAREALKERALV